MTSNWYSFPTPLQMPSHHLVRGRCRTGCKKGIGREERNLSARIPAAYEGGTQWNTWEIQIEKKLHRTPMTPRICSFPTPWPRPFQLRRQGRSPGGCKREVERAERNVSARIRVIRIGMRGKFKLKKSCIVHQLFQGCVRFQRLRKCLPAIRSDVVGEQAVKVG